MLAFARAALDARYTEPFDSPEFMPLDARRPLDLSILAGYEVEEREKYTTGWAYPVLQAQDAHSLLQARKTDGA